MTYGGPDSATASFSGSCRDRAGNSANRTFGLKYDSTAPAVTAGQAARGPDVNGWYNHAVSVDFSGTDQLSGIDTCTSRSYEGPDSATASLTGTCTDDAGNVSAPLGFGLRYDGTAPVVTGGQAGRAADLNGWYNRPVSIAFDGSDQTSGIDACTNTTYGGPDSGAASVPGACKDKAGNLSGALGFGLKYDATGPVVASATPGRGADANGWYNHPVAFAIDGTDATSGLADCPPVTYSAPDSAAGSVTGQCSDRAGNASSRTFGLKYDSTAPAVTGSQPARGTDVNGWYNHPVSVAFSGTDQLSGVDTCTTTTYGGPDGGAASVPGTCKDKAGNVSGASTFGLKYDGTAPAVTGGQPGRGADANGWYNHPVAITFDGADQTAGIDACTAATYSGPDSDTASLAGTCRDRAGNTSSPLPFGLKYDGTGPVVAGANPERSPNAAGWFNRPVRFDVTGTDDTSGVADCPPVTYSSPDSAAGSVTGLCRDRAGNASSRAFGLKYDSTAPAVTGSQAARGADVNGWYNHPVSVAFSGTDQLSGVDTCTTTTYGGPDGGAASVPGVCSDRAGNVSGPSAFGLKYDGTAPVVTGGQPGRGADVDGWYNHPVSITFDGTDQTAGIDACAAATYSGPNSATASLAGTCRDRAGNLSPPFPYGLKYDAAGPVVTAATPGRGPDANGWYNHAVAFTIDGTDATSGLAACPPVTYSAPDSAAGSVTGQCRDRAGNLSSPGLPAQVRQHRATGFRGHAGAPAERRRLVQPRRFRRLPWHRPAVRHRHLRDEGLRGAGQRHSLPFRDLHRRRGQCQRTAGLWAALRRDRARRDWRGAGARSGPERLVQPPGLDRVRRLGPDRGHRRLHEHHLRRPGQRRGIGLRRLYRQGRKSQRRARLRPQVRRDGPGRDRREPRAAARPSRLVHPAGALRLHGNGRDVGPARMSACHLRGT